MHLSSLWWGLRRDNTRGSLSPWELVCVLPAAPPSISHSYWISHPESLGKWGKSFIFKPSLEPGIQTPEWKGQPALNQMKIKQAPGGSWQEVQLASPVLTSLGPVRVLFWEAAGLLRVLSVNMLHWVWTSNHHEFKELPGFPLSAWQSRVPGLSSETDRDRWLCD